MRDRTTALQCFSLVRFLGFRAEKLDGVCLEREALIASSASQNEEYVKEIKISGGRFLLASSNLLFVNRKDSNIKKKQALSLTHAVMYLALFYLLLLNPPRLLPQFSLFESL